MTPHRIQRRRVKGWRKPANTIIVDRTSAWGNPYAAKDHGDCAPALLVAMFRDWLKSDDQKAAALLENIGALRGKNLCCPCPLDQPCHADVLLEIANR